MSRGRRRKFKIKFDVKPDTIRSIISLVFLSLAVITLISFFAPNYEVNSRIQHILRLSFGKASVLIPFLLGGIGILFIDRVNIKFKEIRILLGLFLSLISLSSLFHLFIDKEEALSIAKSGGGGGMFGYKISSILSGGLSNIGAAIILITLLLASIVLAFNISFEAILAFFRENEFISNLLEKLKGLVHFEKKEKEESDIEVNVESVGFEDTSTARERNTKEEEPEQHPLFEVIQSMSEPQTNNARNTVDSLALAPSLEISRVPSDRIWNYPPDSILAEPPVRVWDTSDVDKRVKIIKETLKSFGVDVDIDMENVKVGPTVTQYAVKTKSVTNISKISSLQGNLALALASPTGSVRIEAPIPGKSLIGIEVPNTKRTFVYFKSLLNSDVMKNMKSKLAIALGEDVSGKVIAYDIGKMPHLLIAGTTGSGKSIFLHNVLFSILFRASPQEVKFIIIDPKRGVEFNHYEGIPHLLTPVVSDMDMAPSVFRWAVEEVDRRYKLFGQARVNNIDAYNEKSGIQVMPYIVIVVDELGDIMLKDPAGVEKSIIKLAQLARAAGIHLVLAVQRPSADIITGLIKANIPCRVAFQVLSQINSRVIIDQPGAEKLLGKGDMLFIPPDIMKTIRIQGAYISDKEIADLSEYLRSQGIDPEYKEDVLKMPTDSSRKGRPSDWGEGVDDFFDEAVDIVISAEKASASLLQRKLSIGYARAARIIDDMEVKGIVGPEVSGSRGREIIMNNSPYGLEKHEADPGFDAEDFTDEDFPKNQE